MKLNGLDKFILSHETNHTHYNSHFILNITGNIDLPRFEKTVYSLGEQIPLLRTTIQTLPWNYRRKMHSKSWFRKQNLIHYANNITQQQQDDFCNKAFDLKREAPLRFLISKENFGYQVIMSVHHSLCDGGGQALLLEEFLRVWNNEPVSKYAAKTDSIRFRDLLKEMGFLWKLKKIYEHKPSLKKQRHYKMASLVDYPESIERKITTRTYDLSKTKGTILRRNYEHLKCSVAEYVTFCSFQALGKCLAEKGSQDPIMVYVPKNMRPDFHLRKSLQNILATILLIAKPQDLRSDQFLSKIQKRMHDFDIESAAPFIFRVLLPDRFTPPKILKRRYQKMDQDPQNQTCTFFVSAGLLSKRTKFPAKWGNVQLSARGTLLKSPSMGFILTGFKGAETLTLEYVQSLYKTETIALFEKYFFEELYQIRYKSDPLSEPHAPQAVLESNPSQML